MANENRQQIDMSNKEKRIQMAGWLVEEGYTVRQKKVKVNPTGKSVKMVLECWREAPDK